ncbi:Ctr copper transporter family-domain-containing protein [Naematelia encephala]|uniref:Copper transport protein n=1 Tax=Naematelia encephala TaxID=71784 RepID=A0A1Y2BE50_9TREE|nr:Ctr copper transporter family-domain-containing protein [Naematelia encephala]
MGMETKMYFHGSIGTDMLYFASWTPTSAGATVGVCIALFMLGMFERYLYALRRACDVSWRKGQIGLAIPKSSGPITFSSSSSSSSSTALASSSTSSSQPPNLRQTSTSSSSLEILPVAAPTYFANSSSSSSSSSDPDQKINTDAEKGTETDEKNNLHHHLPKAIRSRLIETDDERHGRWSRPFRLDVDLPRGLLQALQTLMHYLLMLVVMTFNIWWLVSVVVGAGVGEMLFGRFGSQFDLYHM